MDKSEREYNEWLDGAMDEKTRTEYEAELSASERAEADKWAMIRGALREETVPALKHPDFLNSRVLEEIRREIKPERRPLPSLRPLFGWGLAAAVAAVVLGTVFLRQEMGISSEDRFFSQVLSTRVADPSLSVTSFKAPDKRGVVIWIDGTDYIPPTQTVQ